MKKSTKVDVILQNYCALWRVFNDGFAKDKFVILLPVVYPLNKSRCKCVIVGIKMDYENRIAKPVVGIMDQKWEGILFSEESWCEFTPCFTDIYEYFNSYSRKSNNHLNEASIQSGFSVEYTTLNCSSLISKILCIREVGLDSRDPPINQGSIMIQSKTFDVLQ